MSDSHEAANDAEPAELDPEIEALLGFEPVPRRFKRGDGWTAPLQRAFIAKLAVTGAPGKACNALGKQRSGVDKLYKAAGADSFRAAWDRAVELAAERAAKRIDEEHRAASELKPPSLDNRRNPSPERGEGERPSPERGEGEEEEEGWSDEEAMRLLGAVLAKLLRKVAAEREARLAGRVVAADFYLRQITASEILFDLLASGFGRRAFDALEELRRGEEPWVAIAETPFSRFLDEERRRIWEGAREPERPEHPPRRYLIDRSQGPWGSREHGYCTEIREQGGRASEPAAGVEPEAWARMTATEQRAVFEEQFRRDAEAQVEWESSQRRAYDERRDSSASA